MANWCRCNVNFYNTEEEIEGRISELQAGESHIQLDSGSWICDIEVYGDNLSFSIKWGINDDDILALGRLLNLGSFECYYEETGMALAGKYNFYSEDETVDHKEVLQAYWDDMFRDNDDGYPEHIDMDDYFDIHDLLASRIYDIKDMYDESIHTYSTSLKNMLDETRKILQQNSSERA